MLNTHVLYTLQLAVTLLITFALLFSFYYFYKAQVFKLAPMLAQKTKLIQHYPFNQVVGSIELSIVAISHLLFCLLLLYFFKINMHSIFMEFTLIDCLYGALIGIGSVGLSVLFCTVAIQAVETFAKKNSPCSLTGWAAISHAGWIRHHKHIIKIFPLFFSLFIITMQIGSEETIFRSVLFQTFTPFGKTTAFCIATVLFIYMQALHMPSMLSAMFPMIGATIMGVIHGLLYLYHPSVVPLIISHLTFFIFIVI